MNGVDDALRLQIIEEHLSGASKFSLVRKYKLRDSGRITAWMRTFGMSEYIKPVPSGFMNKKKELSDSEALQELRLENKRLKAELAKAKMSADAYNKMIDVAERVFHVAIRKKAGAKQS